LAHPQAADGGDDVLRVVANILNNEPLTADNGWSSSLGIERGLTNPRQKTSTLQLLKRTSDFQAFVNTFMNFFSWGIYFFFFVASVLEKLMMQKVLQAVP
jgi:hypothetical protein